ncbi:hypothetical protein SGGMMB4_01781 [Sodalis glossinidius str. 'morsitans']|uniref:Phage integrase family protein n=1 Tax=Sodalis glossinidius (strain morsitans) TaxID=343509 RepID=A0A193QHC9_SODGM|nr:hypothetical protein SGGMMB4_01781 [Sodalis glossinidius str. 'morsitans']
MEEKPKNLSDEDPVRIDLFSSKTLYRCAKIRSTPADNGERKFGYFFPAKMTQISYSDSSDHNLTRTGAARYFDYESAVALRNLAAAYGTDMPRYLLAPEVAVLLSKVTDLRKRLFIDALWNTGGRLNEILPLTRGDFVLDDPLTGTPLSLRRLWCCVPSSSVALKNPPLAVHGAAAGRQRSSSRPSGKWKRKYAIIRRVPCPSPILLSFSDSVNGSRPCRLPPAPGSGMSGVKTPPAAG